MNRLLMLSILLACSLRAAEPLPLTLEQAIAAGLEKNHALRAGTVPGRRGGGKGG